MKKFIAAIVFATVASTTAASGAVEQKLYYNAADRAAIRQLPITERPFRPLHVYGNTVRLLHWIGIPVAP